MTILFIEGDSNLSSGEISQSFISHWTIIEQFINHLWDKIITKRKFTGKRKDRLKSINYIISIKLEVLE